MGIFCLAFAVFNCLSSGRGKILLGLLVLAFLFRDGLIQFFVGVGLLSSFVGLARLFFVFRVGLAQLWCRSRAIGARGGSPVRLSHFSLSGMRGNPLLSSHS